MRRIYMTLSLLVCSLYALAQVEQHVKPETLADGGVYVLVNKAMNTSQYMSRTSWDGAFYFLGEADSNYANHALTAIKNDDGTWSFTLNGTTTYGTGEYDEEGNEITATYEGPLYFGVPATMNGQPTNNVNAILIDPVKWNVENSKDYPGFYQLTASEGTGNQNCIGLKLHLNAGVQYAIINEPSNSWYPDFAGGVTRDYDESTGNETVTINDSTSFNWGFVKVEDIPAYMGDLKASKTIDDFYQKFIASGDYEDFEEGFTASYDAAVKIYNDAEYNWEEDPETIQSMLSAKESFYNEIDAAELLEEPTPALTSAINNAKSTFKTAATTSELESAIAALKSAIAAFKEGTGDLTSLGANMSFEDLSAQGGSQTSSVADVPTGWSMFINGNQVQTASDIRQYIANWCGVNNDAEGEGLDGTVAFGIWTSGVPKFELSQQVTGLETGTYIVSAGLMAGANGSGSRLTTQRIFGNLNSAYYGDESMYDAEALDKSEVYSFAGNAEIQTDRELRNVSVRAYVYDGTLTFGVRTDANLAATFRTSGNPAGGDGWFKVDNFTIQKVGYDGNDAAAVANHFVDALQTYVDNDIFEITLEEKIRDVIPTEGVNASTPVDEINNVIITLKDLIPEVESSVAAYKKLAEAVENAYVASEEYSYTPSFKTEFSPALEACEIALDERNASEEQIDEMIAAMNEAIQKMKSEGIQVGEYTAVIKNGSFEDQSAQGNNNSDGVVNPPAGWNLKLNGMDCATSADYSKAGASMGWCAINSGDNIDSDDANGVHWNNQYTDGTHVWGIWAGNVPEVELSQTFSGLPAGTYVLSCDMVVQWNWGGQCLTTQRIFANDYVQMFGAEDTYASHPNDTQDMTIAMGIDESYPDAEYKHMTYAGHYQSQQYGVTDCPRHLELTFGLTEGKDLKIGFRTNNVDVETGTAHPYDSAGWFKLDNFKLLYLSDEVPAGAEAVGRIKGDVNLDGKVDISDIVAIINTIAGDTTYVNTADVNEDTNIDISDIVAVINIIAGQ